MSLLIDGHNLIGQIPTLSLADANDEAELVLLLRQYAARKRGRRVVVVFDGGVYGHPHTLNGYGVECHFAQSPKDADALLIKRIRSIRRRGEWQVVTSDRAVAGAAQAHGVQVISSQAFARLLASPAVPPVCADEKDAHYTSNPQEIQEWLRLFGADTDDAGTDDDAEADTVHP